MHFVKEEVSASLPALSDRFQLCRGCRAVDRGPRKVDAEVEVGDESVTQVLGGEIIRWRRCDESSCDRGSVVSLVVYLLHELCSTSDS